MSRPAGVSEGNAYRKSARLARLVISLRRSSRAPARVTKVTDKPIKYVLLTHYHIVRALGASGFKGADILASDATRGLIAECGRQDMESEIGRFSRLFAAAQSIPGLTWPTVTFPDQI